MVHSCWKMYLSQWSLHQSRRTVWSGQLAMEDSPLPFDHRKSMCQTWDSRVLEVSDILRSGGLARSSAGCVLARRALLRVRVV